MLFIIFGPLFIILLQSFLFKGVCLNNNLITKMTFFSLNQVKSTLTIKNKKRINLIVPFKSNQIIIFYKDYSYQHIELYQNKTLHLGKLQFLVQKCISPSFRREEHKFNTSRNLEDFLCIIGQKDGTTFFGILNIRSTMMKLYQIVAYEKRDQFQTINYHLLLSPFTGHPFLVEITVNVQNGLMIKCFDFNRKKWINQILYLGSKFLNYILLDIPREIMQGNQTNVAFCLIANGQKSQSVHISTILITQPKVLYVNKSQFGVDDSFISENQHHQTSIVSEQQSKKQCTFHFMFTREIKYFRNFTILGGYFTSTKGYLFLIGNSLLFETKQKKQMMRQPTCNYINFLGLLNTLQSNNTFVNLKNFSIGKQIIVREYLGQIQDDMLFIVESPLKKSIHKISPYKILQKSQIYDEQVFSFSSNDSTNNRSSRIMCQMSYDKKSIISYQLVCEQFFQKIKDSPSVIKLTRLLKVSKKMYYKQMLQRWNQRMKQQESFVQTILNCM